MIKLRVRPKFRLHTPLSVAEIQQRLDNELKDNYMPIEGKVMKTHALIRVRPEEQHYWSPQLSLSFEENPEGQKGTLIRGMYGPHPSVWAMFLLGYALSGLLIFFIGIVGFARMNLGMSSMILWVIPFLIGGVIALIMAGQAGQKMGIEQTSLLHRFFEGAMEEHITI